MELTTLSEISGIKTTAGNITGTTYPALRSSKIQSNKGRTLSGSWSHVRRALANDKLYSERTKLVTEWFDVWDSSQRCKFFLKFLRKCTPTELAYIEGWFIQRSPILRQDFAAVLPKWITLYIFSYLDPKSLCQVAQVCWHWHFLAEQDAVWMPKCVRLGWFLPIFPNKKEYGAWKFHYINCIKSLDYKVSAYRVLGSRKTKDLPFDETMTIHDKDKEPDTLDEEKFLDDNESAVIHEQPTRPQWQSSTKSPRILEKDFLSTLGRGSLKKQESADANNNDNVFNHKRSKSVPIDFTRREISKSHHRRGNSSMLAESDIYKQKSLKQGSLAELSKLSLKTKNFHNFSMEGKENQNSLYNTRRSLESKAFHVSTMDDSKIRNDFIYGEPVVLFISSRMPSKEILLDSTRFGIAVIPYDYEGTTLDDLITKLKLRLSGRLARCIGFCIDGDKAHGTAKIIEGATLSISSLNHPRMQEFWKQVCVHIADSKDTCVDFFWPIAASENGLELLEELERITGVPFSSPNGFQGSFTRMETEWLKGTYDEKAMEKYFKKGKIMTWINHCEYFEETMKSIRKSLGLYISQEKIELADQVIGNLAGKLLKIADIAEVEKLCSKLHTVCTSNFHVLPDEEIQERLQRLSNIITEQTDSREETSKTLDTNIPEIQSEQRMQCAFVVYETEMEYQEKLRVLKNVYFNPLSSSVLSNRAIISSNSVKMIFSDCEALEKISSQLTSDLKKRLDSWNSEQCLGDVYLSFSTNLKAYSNFLKNYPTMLRTIQRCVEENPSFRAFLDRQKKSVESRYLSLSSRIMCVVIVLTRLFDKILSIQELLLVATQINSRRSDLLSSLLKCTPSEHKDRQYIAKSLRRLKEMADSFRQVEERVDKEEKFQELQSRIKGCPALSQDGRFLLREMELSELVNNKGQQIDSGSTHIHVRDVTIFLFNDAIVCTRRLTRLKPFRRSIRYELRYEFTIDPRHIRVLDVPNTKYFGNAFTLSFPERDWLLQASSHEDKLSYMSILTEVSSSALPISGKLLSYR